MRKIESIPIAWRVFGQRNTRLEKMTISGVHYVPCGERSYTEVKYRLSWPGFTGSWHYSDPELEYLWNRFAPR